MATTLHVPGPHYALFNLLLVGQVERLKVIFNEATSALTDDVSEVSQFCVSLECCLRHHQRGDDVIKFDMFVGYCSYCCHGYREVEFLG